MNNLPITSNQPASSGTPVHAAQPQAAGIAAGNPSAAAPVPATAAGTPGDGFSIASFVLGLISVIFLPLGTIPGFLGFVLSLDAKRRGSRHSLLTAGRVLSIIGMIAVPALYLLMTVLSLFLTAAMLTIM